MIIRWIALFTFRWTGPANQQVVTSLLSQEHARKFSTSCAHIRSYPFSSYEIVDNEKLHCEVNLTKK